MDGLHRRTLFHALTQLRLFYSLRNLSAKVQTSSELTNLQRCQTSVSISVVKSGATGLKAKCGVDRERERGKHRCPLFAQTQVVTRDTGNAVKPWMEGPDISY